MALAFTYSIERDGMRGRIEPLRVTRQALTAILTCTITSTAADAAQQQHPQQRANVIVVDHKGKTLEIPETWDGAKDVLIEIRLKAGEHGLTEDEILAYNTDRCRMRLSYRWESTIRDPGAIDENRSHFKEKAEAYPIECGLLAGKNPQNMTDEEKKKANERKQQMSAVWGPLVFTIKRAAGKPMLAYNLWRHEPRASDLTELRESIRKNLVELGIQVQVDTALATVEYQQKEHTKNFLTPAQNDLKKYTEKLKLLEQDAKLFAGTSGAPQGHALVQIWEGIKQARTELEVAKKAVERETKTANLFTETIRKLNELIAANEGQQAACGRLSLLKVGALLPSEETPAIFYEFIVPREPAAPPGFSLQRMAEYPHLVDRDRLWALVTNRRIVDHPYGFTLSVTKATAAPPNLAPVRPTFDSLALTSPVAGKSAGPDSARPADCKTLDVDKTSFDAAYVDSILPFEDPLKGNEVLKVTISTYTKQIITDKAETQTTDGTAKQTDTLVKQAQAVDLFKDVAYPQVHQRYYFNFVSGVVLSQLRSRSFTKVNTAIDNPDTKDVNEARYRIDESEGARKVMASMVFSVHPLGVDIHEPVWKNGRPGPRMIPAPAVGFSLTEPRDNFIVGTTIEVFDNVHLFLGAHSGVTKERIITLDDRGQPANVPDADRDANDVKTRDAREWKFAWGLTFNINIVTKIFK